MRGCLPVSICLKLGEFSHVFVVCSSEKKLIVSVWLHYTIFIRSLQYDLCEIHISLGFLLFIFSFLCRSKWVSHLRTWNTLKWHTHSPILFRKRKKKHISNFFSGIFNTIVRIFHIQSRNLHLLSTKRTTSQAF